MAAEPVTALVTTATCTAVGAVVTPILCAIGLDAASIGAGLLGCVVAQIFLPPETVDWRRIAATALGSVIVASFGAPFLSPMVLAAASKAGLSTVTGEHANAVTAALLGGFAKPIVMWLKLKAEKRLNGRRESDA